MTERAERRAKVNTRRRLKRKALRMANEIILRNVFDKSERYVRDEVSFVATMIFEALDETAREVH